MVREGRAASSAAARVGSVVCDASRAHARAFRLDGLLGVGASAAVYAATRDDGVYAALKILHPELVRDPEARGRFDREARVAKIVAHPGVCRFIDEGIDATGAVFLAIELAQGQTIRDRWLAAGKRLAEDEVLFLGEAVAEVLVAAHACGVIHRDLKPENILMEANRRVRVLDFGLAKLTSVDGFDGEETRGEGALGTPAFLPPEQARGLAAAVDGRADVFSLGATMFTLLTGEHVHPGDSMAQQLLSAALDPAPKLVAAAPSCDPRVAEVVDRALAFEVSDRYPDAHAMLEAIRTARARRRGGSALPAAISAVPAASWPAARHDSTRPPAEPKAPALTAGALPSPSSGRGFLWLFVAAIALGGGGYGAFVFMNPRLAPEPASTSADATSAAVEAPAPATAATITTVREDDPDLAASASAAPMDSDAPAPASAPHTDLEAEPVASASATPTARPPPTASTSAPAPPRPPDASGRRRHPFGELR